jgi:hypothetical protein
LLEVNISFSVDAVFLRMGPVTGCPPSVLAPPIPPWGTPSAAGVAGEHPVPPILSKKEMAITTEKNAPLLETELFIDSLHGS